MKKRGSYNSLTIKRKLEIIDAVEKAPPCKKKKDIAEHYKIPPSTLSTILKNKKSLTESQAACGSKNKKRNRDPSRTDVDKALYLWFTE